MHIFPDDRSAEDLVLQIIFLLHTILFFCKKKNDDKNIERSGGFNSVSVEGINSKCHNAQME